jgi:hypothetical protein
VNIKIYSSADYLKLIFEDNGGVLEKLCTESGILEGLSLGTSGVKRSYPQRRSKI